MLASQSKAKSIFLDALEIASLEERRAFLAKECGDDAALRQEVDELLAHQQGVGAFLEGPRPELGTIPQANFLEPIGTQIGPYKLKEQIGEGGMGLVYVAEQHEPIRRKVALKLIKPGMDTRQVIARFEAERQALALMNHANIAKVFDGGETSNGRPYFVMELVKGVPITDYSDQNRLTTRARLELFGQVCAAVQHAHQKGIIHRDIKPSNVIVSSHDGTPVVKIIDFGVAKAIGQQLTDKSVYTNFAQFIGTPLYMSPEQAGQSDLDIDTRTDIYALGVLLYELLTGTTPFDKEQLSKASYDEIRRLIREEEPPKPSTRLSTLNQRAGTTISAQRQSDPRQLCMLLRGELDWIVMKALEKDRTRRYDSARSLADDVECYLKDEPVVACPPSRRYLLGKFLRKHRWGVLTTAACLAVVLLLAGGATWIALDRANQRAESERKSESTKQIIAEELKQADIWLSKERWAESRHALDRAASRLAGFGFRDLEVHIAERNKHLTLVAALDDARLRSSDVLVNGNFDYGAAAAAYETAFANAGLDVSQLPAQQIAAEIKTRAIRNQLVIALDHWAYAKEQSRQAGAELLRTIAQLGDDDLWRRSLRDSLRTKDRPALERLAQDKDVLSQSPANLLILSFCFDKAIAGVPKGNWSQLAQVAKARIDFLRRAQDRYPNDFQLNFALGWALMEGSTIDSTLEKGESVVDSAIASEAMGFFRAALALQPENHRMYVAIAYAFYAQKKLIEAAAACRRAIDLQPNFNAAYHNLGIYLDRLGSFSEAIVAYKQAIDINPNDVSAYQNLGIALQKQGKPAEAQAAFHKAIEINKNDAPAQYNLGLYFSKNKQWPQAIAAYQQALKIDPNFIDAHNNVGKLLCKQGQFVEAEEHHRKVIKINPKHPFGHGNLGLDLHGQKKHVEAVASFRTALKLNPDSTYFIYTAANSAALASSGQGQDAGELGENERAGLRNQALLWLRVELVHQQSLLKEGGDERISVVRSNMNEFQRDQGLESVRSEAALAKLSESERFAWQVFWKEVAELKREADDSK